MLPQRLDLIVIVWVRSRTTAVWRGVAGSPIAEIISMGGAGSTKVGDRFLI